MRKQIFSSRTRLIFYLLIAAGIFINFICMTAPLVKAASWSASNSHNSCGGASPIGSTSMSWEGYSSSTWGNSLVGLYWYDGSNWIKKAESHISDGSGSSNSTWAAAVAFKYVGDWMVVSAHTASYIEGQHNIYGPTFTCE